MEEPRVVVIESSRRSHGETSSRNSRYSYSGGHEPQFNGHLQNSSTEEHLPDIYEVQRYKTVKTVWATVLSLTVQAVLVAVVIQLRWYCSEKQCGIATSSIAIYSNIAVWLFTLVIHCYVRHHRNLLHRYGYAEFYHKTKTTASVPALVFSAGCAVLLTYVTVLHDADCYATNSNNCKPGLDTFGWIQILISLEVVVSFPFLFVYLVHSLHFNKNRLTPDIFRESPLDQDNLSVRRDIGFRSQTLAEELLEKQSDAISYLKLRCEDLTRVIFNLTNQQSDVCNSVDDVHGSASASLNASDAQLLIPWCTL